MTGAQGAAGSGPPSAGWYSGPFGPPQCPALASALPRAAWPGILPWRCCGCCLVFLPSCVASCACFLRSGRIVPLRGPTGLLQVRAFALIPALRGLLRSLAHPFRLRPPGAYSLANLAAFARAFAWSRWLLEIIRLFCRHYPPSRPQTRRAVWEAGRCIGCFWPPRKIRNAAGLPACGVFVLGLRRTLFGPD